MSRPKDLKTAASLLVAAVSAVAVLTLLLSSDFMQRATASSNLYDVQIGSSRHVEFVPGSIQSIDGFRVMDGTKEVEVKLCGIASIDQTQETSVDRLREMVVRSGDSGNIILVPVATNSDGRLVADVFVPLSYSVGEQQGKEIHLNSQLLLEGLASIQVQEIDICPNSSVMRTAEQNAEYQNKGMWKNFRRKEL